MLRKILAASTVATLAIAGSASAAQAPTLGPLTVTKAGHHIPSDVNWHAGKMIRKGTELRRWVVTVHSNDKANVTLKCAPGGTHIGAFQRNGSTVAMGTGSDYDHRALKVHFRARASGGDATGARTTVYALCTTS